MGPCVPHHILAWVGMNQYHHCHLPPHPVSHGSRCLAASVCQDCCCPSPAISACCKITQVRQTTRDPCPEEQTRPAARERQDPSSPRWVPDVSLAMGEDGPGDDEEHPTSSRVRNGQVVWGWQGFGQGHQVRGTRGQAMSSLAAAH